MLTNQRGDPRAFSRHPPACRVEHDYRYPARKRHGGVPESFAYDLRVFARSQEQRRAGVSEVVDANLLKPRGFEDGMEVPTRDAWKIQWCALSRAEDQTVVLVSRPHL